MRHRPVPARTRGLPTCILSLALALPALPAVSLLPSTAFAQAGAFAQPVVALVPGGELILDGESEVTLNFVAYEANGAPMTGLSGRVGGLGDERITEVRPGLYAVTLKPAAVSARGTAQVDFKGRTASKTNIELSWQVAVAPAPKSKVEVTTSPTQAVLGRDTTVSVTIKLTGGDVDAADLLVRASAGEVRNITSLGNGTYVAQYTPPTQQFPQLALITAIDRRNPSKSFGHAVLPLVGQAAFPVKAEPNASVIVQVGDQPYGPVPSDANGAAQVPITVPPGVSQAKIISVVNGKRVEDPLDLQVPPTKRVSLFPVGSSVPADNRVQIPVRAYVALPDGKPDLAATVTFSTGSGTVSAAQHEGNGIYSATWTPAFGSSATKASVQVAVADAKGPQGDALELDLVPGLASAVAMASEPPVLSTGTTNFKLFVKASGGSAGLSGRALVVDSAGARLNGEPRDLGGGDYELAFNSPGNTTVDIAVGVPTNATGNALSRVLLIPLRNSTVPDGQSLVRVAVVSVDAYGYPVANVPVNLLVNSGDGKVSPTVTTNANGVAFATYTAGTTPGYVSLRAAANGYIGAAGFLQAPAGVQPVAAPVSGNAGINALLTSWRGSIGGISLDRAGGLAVAAPETETGPAGPPAALAVKAEPAQVAPGGGVTLRIAVTDAKGRPTEVNPADLVFLAAGAEVSAAQSMGGGNYSALLTVPATASGNINVAVGMKNASVGAPILTIPVSGAAAGAWGAAPPPDTTPTPTPEVKPEEPAKPPKPPREKKPAGEHAWLRAGAGYLGGTYSYYQAATQTGGPIYDQPITVGFDETNPAGNAGFAANAKAWLPFFEYVGFEADVRMSFWKIQLEQGFTEPIADSVTNLNLRAHGRYPLDVGANRFSFGGFLGFQTGDFLYFQQQASADGTGDPTIVYDQLWTVGNTYGLEVTAELGPSFFATGTYQMGFTDYSAIFSDGTDLEVGYTFIPNMYVYGTAGRAHRVSKVYYGDNKDYVGDLEDKMWMFGIGIGYQR